MLRFIKLISNNTIYKVLYRNWRNEIAVRNIIIKDISIASTQYHSQKQLIVHVYDVDKKANRDYAAKDIIEIF